MQNFYQNEIDRRSWLSSFIFSKFSEKSFVNPKSYLFRNYFSVEGKEILLLGNYHREYFFDDLSGQSKLIKSTLLIIQINNDFINLYHFLIKVLLISRKLP